MNWTSYWDDPSPNHRVKTKFFVHAGLFAMFQQVGPIGCNPSFSFFFSLLSKTTPVGEYT
jgi:hypothetical protein